VKTENKKVSKVKIVENVEISHRPNWLRGSRSNNSGEKETGPCLKSMTIKDGVKTGMIHGISPRK